MENILDKIIAHKRKEVEERRSLFPVKLLEKSIYFGTPVVSLRKYVLREDKTGIIAEFKRRSPSMGAINMHAGVERTTIGYMQAGASALSILTDTEFFGGRNEDLTIARRFNFCPILRKDFIIDEYQVIEARSIGADAILLIVAALDEKRIRELSALAASLGMEVLVETHGAEELATALDTGADIIGVNNRDLKTFKVDLERSMELAARIPAHVLRIAESGIHTPEALLKLKHAGFQGFLMGQQFMKFGRPEQACAEFVAELRALEKRTAKVKA